jgi:hypothetical protein
MTPPNRRVVIDSLQRLGNYTQVSARLSTFWSVWLTMMQL